MTCIFDEEVLDTYPEGEEPGVTITHTFEHQKIHATLQGGRSKIYDLMVVVDDIGFSNVLPFSYKITLDSISPSVGSLFGGTLLTLTGTNFSDIVIDNNVFIT